jgi:hypothetical protein
MIFNNLWVLNKPRKTRQAIPIRYKSWPIGYSATVSIIIILNEYKNDIIAKIIKCCGRKRKMIKKIKQIVFTIARFKSDMKNECRLLISERPRVKFV